MSRLNPRNNANVSLFIGALSATPVSGMLGGIDLVIQSGPVIPLNNSFAGYVSGFYPTGILSADLFIQGGNAPLESSFNLYAAGASTGTVNVSLFINGQISGLTSTVDMFCQGAYESSNNLPMFINGASGINATGMTLYVYGFGYNTMSTELFVRGY